MSWEVPYIEANSKYEKVDRTICLLKKDTDPVFAILASSDSNLQEIQMKWEILPKSEYMVEIDRSYTVMVDNGSPVLYYVDLVNITGFLIVTLNSPIDTPHCGVVSIHPLKCPISDYKSDNNVHWQNMYRQGVITINADDYRNRTEEKGFFLQLSSFASNCSCGDLAG